MHRITTRRVPLALGASALLASAVVLVAGSGAVASPAIDANTFCGAGDVTAALAIPAPSGYEKLFGTPNDDDSSSSASGHLDSLHGTSANEIIWGFGGADDISGGGGDDIICGGSEDDKIRGGSGSNHLHGGAGADTIKGGSGTDYIYPDPADTYNQGKGGFNFQCPTAPDC